ncbi:hypothetical protein V2K57_07650 [Pseudomonas alliivorans]|nr:hypothetical protein [Pseudomonas alliivorans]MEE4700271.1 hypothetical protein [Pseudomonas alliivorans]MEE4736250.1 hypothetical protein [Pseudomonas alliivorans]MEE4742778.1 hypothetical protein [Pseudomonas alliivorans]MEE5094957.1 hypothetical protein [Pseudomonas alliivorans]
MGIFVRTFRRILMTASNKAKTGMVQTLEQRAAQEAFELSVMLRVGGPLETDEISIIETRLKSVIKATEAAIAACNKHDDGRANVARLRY